MQFRIFLNRYYFIVMGVHKCRILFRHFEVITVTTFNDVTWCHTCQMACSKFFRGDKNIYLHYMSFLRIGMTHVLKILPQVR